MYTLRAEGHVEDRVLEGQPETFDSLDAIAAFVDKLDESGEWPEGFDAVATDQSTGKVWLYTDGWEEVDITYTRPPERES